MAKGKTMKRIGGSCSKEHTMTRSKGTARRGGDDIDLKVGGKKKKFYKGKSSKTRKGKKDFVTHKGDKYFHRKGHRETKKQKKGLFYNLFNL